ncbi:MAG TPA: NAD(P) transhydrogenase subunit alpha [Anaerovoracaceae bacterium]|nr:NAD(P) transhydrogenase subunit alpha [Anaerovoracaceae bacterium]
MHPLVLIILFIFCALIGYKVITNVPSLLHTPLMTAMNALAGIALLGALTCTALAVHTGNQVLGYLGVFLAVVNVVGGFGLSHRMLKMFKHKEVDSQ